MSFKAVRADKTESGQDVRFVQIFKFVNRFDHIGKKKGASLRSKAERH